MIETKSMKSDKRYKSITLTPRAIEIADDIHNVIEKIKLQLFSEIKSGEQEVLDSIVTKLISNLEKIES